jgi:hypothetical protein
VRRYFEGGRLPLLPRPSKRLAIVKMVTDREASGIASTTHSMDRDKDWVEAMSADWWDPDGSSQREELTRQCWDCGASRHVEMIGPDGVRCIDCWRARAQTDYARRSRGSHPSGGSAARKPRRPNKVRA